MVQELIKLESLFLLLMKLLAFLGALSLTFLTQAQDTIPNTVLNSLKFRNIGPALTSGRIVDLATDPTDFNTYYVAAAYSGVWKTDNAGTTFNPIFDNYGTQSIGCITIDPKDHLKVWVGTGENNNQRSVGYGNGIYLSQNGGKSFTNMGLKGSQHIGMIKVHPNNSDIVYVAAYGPVWNKGGERGLYKTEDAGKTWQRIKHVSEYTGCNEVHLDPDNPNIMYAAFHQRERRQWTYMGGGPESSLFKSSDAGKTWKSITSGFPGGDKGRISMCIAAGNSEKLYAMVETDGKTGGMYISLDRGESWAKTNGTYTSGNYYTEIMADPKDEDRIFIMDTHLQWSKDGGKTVSQVGEKDKHVDNHAIWINPTNTKHWRVGCDGGLYETFDNGKTFDFKSNLPLTQFYRVAIDNDYPFYNIYGGTQDNNTLGGPSANTSANGIPNSDWFITVGGDGFKSQIDPTNPDIVYSQWQYGGLVKFDKKTGNITQVKPTDTEAMRWNWDAPLLISNHNHKVLYYCSNKVFKSEDQGNSWKLISGDLSQNIDRNKLKVMDRLWGPDAVAKDQSVSMYGTIIYFDESRLDANYLAAGTDDGLIQLSKDGGESWNKTSRPSSLPTYAAISAVHYSKFDKETIYATWDNHKDGDFRPYAYVSKNLGKSWQSISTNLPKDGSIKCLAQDHIKSDLLFCGTEFGVFVSPNNGKWWGQLKAGLAPISIMDMEIQERESDLVLATFGRGFSVLDNYASLRDLNSEIYNSNLTILPIKTAKLFNQKNPIGGSGNGNQGANHYQEPNPQYGASINFWVKDVAESPKSIREKVEAEAIKAKKDFAIASIETMREEKKHKGSYAMLVIKDESGVEIRRMRTIAAKGMNKVVWDMRHTDLRILSKVKNNMPGFMVRPGKYTAQITLVENGIVKETSNEQNFELKEIIPNTIQTLSNAEAAKATIDIRMASLNLSALSMKFNSFDKRIAALSKAAYSVNIPMDATAVAKELRESYESISIDLYGDKLKDKYEKERSQGLMELLGGANWAMSGTTSGATGTHLTLLKQAQDLLPQMKIKVNNLETSIKAQEDSLRALGVIILE